MLGSSRTNMPFSERPQQPEHAYIVVGRSSLELKLDNGLEAYCSGRVNAVSSVCRWHCVLQ